MKIVTIQSEKINDIFEELKLNFGGELQIDLDEYCLQIDNDFAKGSIIGASFDDTIAYLQFDMLFYDKITVNILNRDASSVYFAYCSKGNLLHSFGVSGTGRKLKNYQTAIISSKKNKNNVLYFDENRSTKFNLITLGIDVSKQHQKSFLHQKIKETFFEDANEKEFFYLGSYNLQIAEKIEQLEAVNQSGVVGNLLKEGILRIILAMEIQQHSDDLYHFSKDTNCLTLKEMEEIKELSDFIKSCPEEAFTIKNLSKKSGLSPNKLQEGFKLIHNRTVNDYITHMRVVKAEILIRTSDLNISEVVYCIGFTSRSYFSKIFKQKFNCSPKDYKSSTNPLAITA